MQPRERKQTAKKRQIDRHFSLRCLTLYLVTNSWLIIVIASFSFKVSTSVNTENKQNWVCFFFCFFFRVYLGILQHPLFHNFSGPIFLGRGFFCRYHRKGRQLRSNLTRNKKCSCSLPVYFFSLLHVTSLTCRRIKFQI